jgi:transmembrane sensor
MSKKDATDLLERYRNGQASEEERALVETWYAAYTQNAEYPEIEDEELENDRDELLRRIMSQIPPVQKNHYRFISIAASIIILLCAAAFFVNQHNTPTECLSEGPKKGNDSLPPGGNKAILILSNGSSINLGETKNGTLANEKGVVVNKDADGQITYNEGSSTEVPQTGLFNTVVTPNGGQYQLVLSDGTKVWLNSATTFKFPVVFTGGMREVELSGEAYFEASHDPHKPFRVISEGQIVEVLGTHFNINTYKDEKVSKTTLFQGSVRVLSGNKSSKIKPGEQVQQINGALTVSEADLEEAAAWKNGLFYFKDDNIETIMRQLCRWYDVSVRYEGQIPSREFSGQMNKNINASQLLHILSIEQIHYRIEDRTIVITP